MDPKATGAKPPRHEPVGRADSPSTGSANETLRHVRLETGHTLRTWDTGRLTGAGMMARTRVGYELRDPAGKVLFHGTDFGPGAATGDDSNEALRGLCGFLFLRPGDTDRELFNGYTAEQLAFAQSCECELLAFLYSDEGCGTFADIAADGGPADDVYDGSDLRCRACGRPSECGDCGCADDDNGGREDSRAEGV